MKRRHEMPFGARLDGVGGARFRLWAPDARSVDLLIGPADAAVPTPMEARPGGWFDAGAADAPPGTRYAFRIDGGLVVPDPASRRNPDDVHRASELVDPEAFEWPDDGWRGRPWHEAVIYELHVGCLTPEGTFTAAIGRLDDLVALGITAIELMPIADFPGRRGWGYDGVLPYAPESAYGTPDELKRLVAAAHARGLMVLLDVVYNHFGPDGNYLHAYASPFFNAAVHTPWGAAMNFDAPGSRTVRDFFIHNALYWFEEFHLDGLRLDAVHAMHDSTAPHFIDELARAVRDGPGRERAVHLVLENATNDADRLARAADGSAGLADAQWNDDVHHCLHVLVTGETDGYYADFAAPTRLFARALAEGFAFQGDPSPYHDGAARGTPSAGLPPSAFVNSLQTHDQVGNRALGDRIGRLALEHGREAALRAAVACVLLAPAVPMLFMGEEFDASTPFLYFCDFQGDLARAVTEGRRNEFAHFPRFSDPALRDEIPDPNDPATFAQSRLQWDERATPPHASCLALYTELLRVRRERLMPLLAGARSGRWRTGEGGRIDVEWPLAGGASLHLAANLADAASADIPAALPPGEVVWQSPPDAPFGAPWSVRFSLERP